LVLAKDFPEALAWMTLNVVQVRAGAVLRHLVAAIGVLSDHSNKDTPDIEELSLGTRIVQFLRRTAPHCLT